MNLIVTRSHWKLLEFLLTWANAIIQLAVIGEGTVGIIVIQTFLTIHYLLVICIYILITK